MLGPVSTWMGDRLGTPGAVVIFLKLLKSEEEMMFFLSLDSFCPKALQMPPYSKIRVVC